MPPTTTPRTMTCPIAGIVLRHRTGGHDAGWHLKRPELDDHEVRTEFRVGGDSTRVPEEIVDQVAALARGRALQPIVHIRTQRSERGLLDADGRRLATVADDRVAARRLDQDSASTLRWRELEVELVDGPPTLLDDVATSLAMEGVRRSEWPSKLSHALGQVSDPPPFIGSGTPPAFPRPERCSWRTWPTW